MLRTRHLSCPRRMRHAFCKWRTSSSLPVKHRSCGLCSAICSHKHAIRRQVLSLIHSRLPRRYAHQLLLRHCHRQWSHRVYPSHGCLRLHLRRFQQSVAHPTQLNSHGQMNFGQIDAARLAASHPNEGAGSDFIMRGHEDKLLASLTFQARALSRPLPFGQGSQCPQNMPQPHKQPYQRRHMWRTVRTLHPYDKDGQTPRA